MAGMKSKSCSNKDRVYLIVPGIISKEQTVLNTGKKLEMKLREGLEDNIETIAFCTHHLTSRLIHKIFVEPLDPNGSGAKRTAYEPLLYCATLEKNNPLRSQLTNNGEITDGMIRLTIQGVRLFNHNIDAKRSLSLSFHLHKLADLLYLYRIVPDEELSIAEHLREEGTELCNVLKNIDTEARFGLDLDVFIYVFDSYYKTQKTMLDALADYSPQPRCLKQTV